MKHSTLSPLLLAGALLANSAFAQEAAPPAAEATEATAAATADAAAPAAETTVATAAATEAAAAVPATDAAPASDAAPAAAPVAQAPVAGDFSAAVQAAIGVPEPGKAQVVFFRASKFAGGAIKFKVREGETELGKLASGRFFVVNVEPGAHAYTVHSEAKDVTNVELEAGETYFLAGSISMGVMVGHPNLSPSDAAAFEVALKKMKKI